MSDNNNLIVYKEDINLVFYNNPEMCFECNKIGLICKMRAKIFAGCKSDIWQDVKQDLH